MSYEKLRYLMYEKKVIKADIIRETGITRPTLNNWEKGKSTPTLKTLRILAEYFHVPVSYFVED